MRVEKITCYSSIDLSNTLSLGFTVGFKTTCINNYIASQYVLYRLVLNIKTTECN